MREPHTKSVTLEKEVDQAIEEGRMVLPGIQALFGFQLIAVFNQRFETGLTAMGQRLHLGAIVCVVISIALIMAPAAFHRQAYRGLVSTELTNYASKIITIAMVPLMVAIIVEVALIAQLITHSWWPGNLIAGMLSLFFIWFWFAFPQLRRKQRHNAQDVPSYHNIYRMDVRQID